jgi:hypothetical protein
VMIWRKHSEILLNPWARGCPKDQHSHDFVSEVVAQSDNFLTGLWFIVTTKVLAWSVS